jgi:ribosome-binding factor A
MRKTRRTSRVGEMLRDALVEVLRHDVKDVAQGLASVNEVEVSPDLHLARIYMSGFNEEETRNVVLALQQRAPRIRSLLGKRIRLRYTPELDFRYDDTAARAGRIESLLHDLKANEDDDGDDES